MAVRSLPHGHDADGTAALSDAHPILLFEYSLDLRKDALRQSIDAIIRLQELGYSRFLVYDNFGNHVQLIDDDVIDRFRDMNRYLLSQRLFGQKVIHHYDIGGFHSADADLAIELRDYHRAVVDRRIRETGLEA